MRSLTIVGFFVVVGYASVAVAHPCATMAYREVLRRGMPLADTGIGVRPDDDVDAFLDSAAHTIKVHYGPGVSVGGGNFGMKISDLVLGAKLYALTALELCDQARA